MKIIDKIQKLLRHAESARQIGNIAEAEAFAAHVQTLLIQHKLDIATVERTMLDLEDPIEHRFVEGDEFGQRSKKRREGWTEGLACVIAENHFCRMAVTPNSNAITFFGRRSDIEITIFMFTYLSRLAAKFGQLELALAKFPYRKVKHRKPTANPTWRHQITGKKWVGDKRFLDSFHLGFRAAINWRYVEQRKAAETDQIQALVLGRSDNAVAEFAAQFTSPARKVKLAASHVDAQAVGWAKGQEVDLNLKGVRSSQPVAGLLQS